MAETEERSQGNPRHPMHAPDLLSESESRFQQIIEYLPEAVLVQFGNEVVFANRFCTQLHGASSAEQLIGKDIADFLQPPFVPALRERIQGCYATGQASAPLEAVLTALDGSLVDVEVVATPVSWKGSTAIEMVLRVIGERKRAEAAVLKSHKRLELAQKAGLRIGLWDWDVASNKASWSDETYRQFGFTRETFSGRVEDAAIRIHPEDRPRVLAAMNRVLTGAAKDYSEQYRVVRPDGTMSWIDAQGVLVSNGSLHMIGIGVDITSLKRAEQSIQESESRYRNLFENATYGMYLARLDGTLIDANPAMVRMLGYNSKEELLARNVERDVYECPETRQSIIARIDSGGRLGGEVNWRRKDGKIIVVRLNGGAIRRDDGQLSHLEVMVEDVTERRNLEEQLRHSQKMEAIGLLVGGISHDFNNLLGVILGNADLLLEKLPPDAPKRYAEAIKKAGSSAAQLVRQLLAFSRKQVLYPAVIDINTAVSDTGKILKRLIGEDVRVVSELDNDLDNILADRGQIEQILMNLATNARDAMPNGGTFTICTRNCDLAENEVARHSYMKPGRYVHLSVHDTGIGMSEEVRARIFEPFFTTKEKGRGTGLGLATVYGIVKQSGGYVWVTSEPGSGTTFDFFFPSVAERVPASAPKILVQCEYPRGTETILVLEDEDCLRNITCEFLQESGYHVLQAGHGAAAIESARQCKDPIALIISDVVLPEISGPDAVAKMRAAHPEAQVLYISGYAEVPVAQQLIAEGAVVMQKPVTRQSLLEKVDEMLHRRTKLVPRIAERRSLLA